MKTKSKTYYYDVGAVPCYLGWCPDKTSWDREMRRFGASSEYPQSGGRCTRFAWKGGETIILITFNPKEKTTLAQVAGIIAHEAVHAVDFFIEAMDDHEASAEFRAYNVQMITQSILSDYIKLKDKQ